MRGLVVFVLVGLFAAPAYAKPLPASYGYGRAAGDAAPVLDLRGLLPPGRESGPLLPPVKSAPTDAADVARPTSAGVVADCYDPAREGGQTASGEAYRPTALSASHPDMPLSSLALITNVQNGKEVIVRVNDRPASAALEMSPAAAEALGAGEACSAQVTVRRLGAAPYAAPGRPTPVALTVRPQAELPRERAPEAAQGAFLVQVGAFSQRENAEAARAQAASAGPVSIEPAIVGGVSLFRVRLGPWTSQEEAERARAAAEALGFAGAKLTAR